MRRRRGIIIVGVVVTLSVALTACGGEDEPVSLRNGEQYPATVVEQGADIFRTSCQACHGARGQGGRGPALQDVWTHLSYDDHVEIVRLGVDNNMPAFGTSLTEEELLAVVAYERAGLSTENQ